MSYWTDSANRCAKCGCNLTGRDEGNARSPWDEDVCVACDGYAGLTEDVMSEMAEYFGATGADALNNQPQER